MEAGDWTKATYYWQEAARLCYTPLQRGYFVFLQARALEVQGECHRAVGLYRDALRDGPKWTEPMYRQGVCLIKMGFTDQGMQYFLQLLPGDTAMFNRIMVDPELERGRLQVLTILWRIWKTAQDEVKVHLAALTALSNSMRAHFLEGEPYLTETEATVQELGKLGRVNNYVSFIRLGEGLANLKEAFKKKLDAEIRGMGQIQMRQYEELKEVQREAAWFPFPALLREFNRDFNFCAARLNWTRTTPMFAQPQAMDVAEFAFGLVLAGDVFLVADDPVGAGKVRVGQAEEPVGLAVVVPGEQDFRRRIAGKVGGQEFDEAPVEVFDIEDFRAEDDVEAPTEAVGGKIGPRHFGPVAQPVLEHVDPGKEQGIGVDVGDDAVEAAAGGEKAADAHAGADFKQGAALVRIEVVEEMAEQHVPGQGFAGVAQAKRRADGVAHQGFVVGFGQPG